MPDKAPGGKVITGLLTKPESRGPVTLKKVAWKDEDPLTRFMGGFVGNDDSGGGRAGLAGAMLGMLNPFDDVMRGAKMFKVGGRNQMNNIAGIAETVGPGYVKSALPQLEDAFDESGRLTPEIAAESARLMSEMMDNPTIKKAYQEFSKVNPEAAGHVQSFNTDPFKTSFLQRWFGATNAGSMTPATDRVIKGFPEAEFQSKIRIDPKNFMNRKPAGLADSVGHELEHGSQLLKLGRNLSPQYDIASQVIGYKNNPYEVAANKMGKMISKLVTGK